MEIHSRAVNSMGTETLMYGAVHSQDTWQKHLPVDVIFLEHEISKVKLSGV